MREEWGGIAGGAKNSASGPQVRIRSKSYNHSLRSKRGFVTHVTLSYSMRLKRYHGSFFLLWSCGVVNFSLRRRRRPRGRFSRARRVKQRPCKMMAGSLQAAQQGRGRGRKEEEVSDSGPEPLARLASGTLASILSKSSSAHRDPAHGHATDQLLLPSRFFKAAIKQVKEWVESYIPPGAPRQPHLRRRRLRGARAPNPQSAPRRYIATLPARDPISAGFAPATTACA